MLEADIKSQVKQIHGVAWSSSSCGKFVLVHVLHEIMKTGMIRALWCLPLRQNWCSLRISPVWQALVHATLTITFTENVLEWTDWSSKLQSSHFLCHYNCFCNSNSSMGKDPADTMANIVRFNIYVIFMNCQFTDSWQSHWRKGVKQSFVIISKWELTIKRYEKNKILLTFHPSMTPWWMWLIHIFLRCVGADFDREPPQLGTNNFR